MIVRKDNLQEMKKKPNVKQNICKPDAGVCGGMESEFGCRCCLRLEDA